MCGMLMACLMYKVTPHLFPHFTWVEQRRGETWEGKGLHSCHQIEKIWRNSYTYSSNFCANWLQCSNLSFLLSLLFYPSSQYLAAVMPRFAEQVEVAIEALSTNPPQTFEENEFIDASRLVYDGVRDIRKAVLMIRVWPLSYLNKYLK